VPHVLPEISEYINKFRTLNAETEAKLEDTKLQ
jgi:hypothetical protein